MDSVLERIGELGIVPVVKLGDPGEALGLGKALLAADLPVAEVTFRTPAAEESIRVLASQVPELLVGAGTVLSTEQADRAIGAGARFIVAPGLNPRVVEHCLGRGVTVIPGVDSATQIETALEMGLAALKFFPAEASGGVEKIKALSAPFADVRFVPTGGITPSNMSGYLDLPQVLAVGGSWMVKQELLASGSFAEVTRLAREAVLSMLGFKVRHVGINEASPERARESADAFAELFGFRVREASGSYFLDPAIEILKRPGRGERGHLAVETSSMRRATAYLLRRGFRLLPDGGARPGVEPDFAYLEREISGFAIHLLKR